ncbi:B2 protein-like isoform X2 [Diabrotica undecimpunctata]|uniref:B2 protein-like isoform X2 n=1 Tax=Diabrotica undecimpunctata TaxID=50387 RepID=UPI003B63EA21
MNTYYVISFLAVTFLSGIESLSEAEQAMMFSLHQKCLPISGATDEMAKQAMTGNFPEDPAFKEHVYCMSKAYGFFKENGEINIGVVESELHKRIADPVLRTEIKAKCLVLKESPQETAFQATKCLFAYKENIM